MVPAEIDPTNALSTVLNRRTFVGVAAGAAVPALALASKSGGEPHAPYVAEDHPAIAAQRVPLSSSAGALSAYTAKPAHANGSTPSVVVVMHVWGVDTSIRDVVRRLAKAGFVAIAPDLYARMNAPSGDGSTDFAIFRQYAQRLTSEREDADIAAAAAWLREGFPTTKIAVMGFCMGGRIAMRAAIDNAGTFAAVCSFYGDVKTIDPRAIVIPYYGSYGARDTGIPAENVRAFAASLTVAHDVRIYDEAGHAFFDDQRASYVATAAADGWNRLLRFLQKYLGPPAS